jgi:seryl-tRNA synthetase
VAPSRHPQAILNLDDARREHLTKLQDAQSARNTASKAIGKAKAIRR